MSAYNFQQRADSTAEIAASNSPSEKGKLIVVAYSGSLLLVMIPWLGFLGYTAWQIVRWLFQ